VLTRPVLVVDDEDLVLRLAKPALERYGYYRAAMSPHNSLDRGEAQPPTG